MDCSTPLCQLCYAASSWLQSVFFWLESWEATTPYNLLIFGNWLENMMKPLKIRLSVFAFNCISSGHGFVDQLTCSQLLWKQHIRYFFIFDSCSSVDPSKCLYLFLILLDLLLKVITISWCESEITEFGGMWKAIHKESNWYVRFWQSRKLLTSVFCLRWGLLRLSAYQWCCRVVSWTLPDSQEEMLSAGQGKKAHTQQFLET